MNYKIIDGIKMKKILLFIGLVLFMIFQGYSTNFICNGDITLNNYTINNNISINNNCYAIRFKYENLNSSNSSNIIFNINNNGNNGKNTFLFYDNSNESDYNNQIIKPFKFNFLGFNYLNFKYGSDYKLITSNSINRNKFVGTKNTSADIYVENNIISGGKYFISGSLNNFNNINLNFENFANSENLNGEYRVFLNNINNVNIYTDTTNPNSNEKILIIKNNVNNIMLNDNINENNNDYRIKTITYNEFMSSNINKIYMKNYLDTSNNKINKNINTQSDKSIVNTISKIYETDKIPFGFGLFGMLLVLITISFIRKEENFFENKKPKFMIYNMLLLLLILFIILYFTKNPLYTMIGSIFFSSVLTLIYYRKTLKDKNLNKFIIFIISIMLIITIIYYIYLHFML